MLKKAILVAGLSSTILVSCGGGNGGNSEFVSLSASVDNPTISDPVISIQKDANNQIVGYSIPQGKSVAINVSYNYLGDSNNPPNFIVKEATINYGGYFTRTVNLATSIASGGTAIINLPLTTTDLKKKPPFLLANELEDKTINISTEKQIADAYATYKTITTNHAYSDNFSIMTGDQIRPTSVYVIATDDEQNNFTCSDDGNGNMTGANCSGAVNYANGTITVNWTIDRNTFNPNQIILQRDVYQGNDVIFDISDKVANGETVSNIIIKADGTPICDLNGNISNGCSVNQRYSGQYVYTINGLDKTTPVSLTAEIIKSKHIDLNSSYTITNASPQTINTTITLKGSTVDGDNGEATVNVVIDAYTENK